ncbi:hypothetical protein HDV00_001135 [Rhizophlyctis rosea]|nr:hypothetical protein HDV00_001135 [Rhizophlyctis rosea]
MVEMPGREEGVEYEASLVVLSSGNNYGLGAVRKQELLGSCKTLGIAEGHCVVLDVPDLQDNPKLWWQEAKVAEIGQEYIDKWNIDAIITFDSGGVSGHINHRSVHSGIR